MIINRLQTGGGGFELPPFAPTENFTYNTYTENGTTYARLMGFNFDGWVGTSVTVPETLGGYEVKQISNDAFITGNFGTLSEIVVPFNFFWYQNSNTSNKQRISSKITKITANFPNLSTYSIFRNSNVIEFNSNVQYTSTIQGQFKNTKISNFSNIGKYIIIGNNETFYSSNCKGNEFINMKTIYGGHKSISITDDNFYGPFQNCQLIINANFPELEIIEDGGSSDYAAFSKCYSMKTFKANKLVSLGQCAFAYCSSLTSIYVNSLSDINFGNNSNQSPFYNCSKLANIYTSQENYDALKSVFENAPYSSYGTNLAQYVKVTPAE